MNTRRRPTAVPGYDNNEWVIHDPGSDEFAEEFDEAMGLSYAGRRQESMHRLVEVLNKHPWHIDALHHLALAYGAQGRGAEYRALEREAARVALGALPEGFDWRKSRIVYGVLDNRPFFRACHGLSVLMLEEGDEKGARQMWRRLLAVNPDDNQGCRMLLMDSLIQSKEWKKALAHAARHKDDGVWLAYGRALAHAGLGQRGETLKCLEAGTQAAIRTGALVSGRLDLLRYIEDNRIGGDVNHEAYWEANRKAWSRPEAQLARELLTDHVEHWIVGQVTGVLERRKALGM